MQHKLPILASMTISIFFVILATLYSERKVETYTPVPFLQENSRWADSVLRKMDLRAKIGQLLLVTGEPDTTEKVRPMTNFIREYQPGGVIFRNYGAEQQWQRTQIYQQVATTPLLIGMYSDPGPADLIRLPEDWSYAAIRNDSLLINEVGKALAGQARQMDVHLYINPIGSDLFNSYNRPQLIRKTVNITSVLQDNRILSTPGVAYAYYPYEKDSLILDSLLTPYDQLSRTGTSGMLISPEIIDNIKLNSSKTDIIKNYLSGHISFRGLILGQISGDIDDRVSKSLKAGVDMMLVSKNDLPEAYDAVLNACVRNQLSDEDLNNKVRRILLAKSWTRARESFARASLDRPLNVQTGFNQYWNRKLEQASLTVIRDEGQVLPFTDLEERKFHLLTIGEETLDFLNQLRLYAPFSSSRISRKDDQPLRRPDVQFLSGYNPLIVAFNHEYPDVYADADFIDALKQLGTKTRVVFVNLGDVEKLAGLLQSGQMVQAYGSFEPSHILAAQALFGGITPGGRLPLHINDTLAYGSGLNTPALRLAYNLPEAVGMSSDSLKRIDSLVYEAIGSFAVPGAQVLVARKGQVVYHKAFGYHTYAEDQRVNLMDLYDIASVTKIAATTTAAMLMNSRGKLKPEDRLGKFFRDQLIWVDSVSRADTTFVMDTVKNQLPDSLNFFAEADTQTSPFILVAQRQINRNTRTDTFRNGDTLMIVKSYFRGKRRRKAEIFGLTLAELLTHRSGLPAGLPILPYMQYRDSVTGRYGKYFRPKPDSLHSIEVAGDFFLRNDYRDSLWLAAKKMGINPGKTYEYSDANMILVQQAIDSINQEPISDFLARELYGPLGMQHARFNPRHTLEPERLVPTQYDAGWRGQLLRGYVHDPTAALLGGVSGNAGLFSNANDLAILMQMILNGGTYGGETYIDPEVIETFTRAQGGHRGYGFDKPPLYGGYIIGDQASMTSYGHTGFTGTCIWVDPDQELIYIFLSNRVHPKAGNWKLNTLRIRQRIHDVIYSSIIF